MKKLYFSLIAFAMLTFSAHTLMAQCTIHPHTQAGFYPLNTAGIHPAAATAPYALNVTIVIPPDTVIAPFPALTIDSARVQSFIGFPANFTYQYLPASGWIKGGQSGCILVSGTPGNADIGIHSISFVFTAMIMGFAYTDTIENYWQFEVKDASHIGVLDAAADQALQLFPNPASDYVQIIPEVSGQNSVEIYQLSGKKVIARDFFIAAGEPIILDTKSLTPGIYSVVIRSAAGTRLEKLTIIR